MPSLPPPLLAALGLAAEALDRAKVEARRLPDNAVELPMTLVSLALQASMRANQHYAHLIGRGEELLNKVLVSDDPPPWATFDDETEATDVTDLDASRKRARSRFDAVEDPGDPAVDG